MGRRTFKGRAPDKIRVGYQAPPPPQNPSRSRDRFDYRHGNGLRCIIFGHSWLEHESAAHDFYCTRCLKGVYK